MCVCVCVCVCMHACVCACVRACVCVRACTFRWCLYLRHLSSSAYEVLRNSGVLRLPSQRTLRDYTYHTESAPGFSASVDKYLMDTADINTCPERERNVILILDEMHIRESLVYDKHTGKGNIVGMAHSITMGKGYLVPSVHQLESYYQQYPPQSHCFRWHHWIY